MRSSLRSFVFSLVVLSSPTFARPRTSISQRDLTAAQTACAQISNAVSSASEVALPGTFTYLKDVSHWAASSADIATCSFEPGSVADLSIAMGIIASLRPPFAVKGGGHASNPGFSSTPGVQIAMYRFSEVTYDAQAGTVDVGAGLIWDDVYAALEPFGVNVVGGRVTGVGVAGFTLGGGYSWLTNQYGLTVDNVQAFDLVLPNGTFTTVTAASNSDLFFGLKGGFNNFGIVTKFTLTARPQGQVWGGLITYTEGQIPAVNDATYQFTLVNDPKASIITTYNFILGAPGVSQLLFYDGPTPPAGIFDAFLAIPHFTMDVSTRSFKSLVQASPANATFGMRGSFNTVALTQYTPNLIATIANQSNFWGQASILSTGSFISYDVEPFSSQYSSFSQGGAYPHSSPLLPLNLYFAWVLPTSDDFFITALEQSAAFILQQAQSEGAAPAQQIKYGNYALADTPLEEIYGGNLAQLRSIKQVYDPNNVMGLAGGFRF